MTLIFVDHRFPVLGPIRSIVGLVTVPFYLLADVPIRIANLSEEHARSRSALLELNQTLTAENRVLKARLQKLVAISAENARLRELLNSTALLDENVLVAEIIGVNPDPNLHVVLIDKGSHDGVFVGQAVIDENGLMGQVVETSVITSRVLLITDASHSVPVRVNRNSIRAIAEGTGFPDVLELRHMAATADIREGDLLVSSGLGQRFPEGYPVAIVDSVIHDPGLPFAIIKATPSAHIDRSRHVLLVFADASRRPVAE